MTSVVRTCGLVKRFGRRVVALDGLDLRVEPGEIYGLLGRNGAGKTTAIRLILGMLRPAAGHAELFGARVGRADGVPWRRVGYLVEGPAAYPDLTARENLEVARRLQAVEDRGAPGAALERLGLRECADVQARALSAGNRQRLALAIALLHRPDLLVLDEPANGLDPAGVVEVRALLREQALERGGAVLLSSHILPEVDRLATRVGILHRGRLVEEWSAGELDRRRRRRLAVAVTGSDRLALAEAALRQAGFAPGRAAASGALLELWDARALEAPDEVARILCAAGAPPSRLAIEQEDLEPHFLRLTAGEAGER
jgi:ABC-2 type transport system ATP-binding protein